jgi:hypothetical protein
LFLLETRNLERWQKRGHSRNSLLKVMLVENMGEWYGNSLTGSRWKEAALVYLL